MAAFASIMYSLRIVYESAFRELLIKVLLAFANELNVTVTQLQYAQN